METDNREVLEAFPVRTLHPGNGVPPAGLVQTKTAYQTALVVQVPRDLNQLEKAVLAEAHAARDSFFYAWTVKNKDGGRDTIEGVSIDGAMILLRNWGNAVCPVEIAVDAPDHWVLRASFIDLETGFTDERLYRQRKGERHGKFDDDRALDIAFQIGQSKAKRNVIIRALPAWLVERSMDAAHAAVEKRFANVAQSVAALVPRFVKFGVTMEMMERKLGKPQGEWLPRDLVQLVAIGRAINEGQTTVAQEFADDAPTETLADQLREALRKKTEAATGKGDLAKAEAKSDAAADPAKVDAPKPQPAITPAPSKGDKRGAPSKQISIVGPNGPVVPDSTDSDDQPPPDEDESK